MNQYSRYIDTNLTCIFFVMCCQRGRSLLSCLYKKKSFQEEENSFIEGENNNEGEVFSVKSKREKISIKGSLVPKFYCTMTCSVSINAKERDCWYNWLIIYCLWRYTTYHIIISQCLPRSPRCWRDFSRSTEHS